MTLSKLKTSEQVLLAVVMLVLILGPYSWFRFVPKNNAIVSLENKAAATERKLLKARIPDEPEQGVDELLKQLDDQEQALALIRTMADSVGDRLASFDSQELKVRISELARNSGIRIRTNEAYIKPLSTFSTVAKKKKKKKKKKKAAVAIAAATDIILPSSYSWIDRMSAGTVFHRPMQRLVLVGDYQSLRAFIHGLAKLDWQVTVVRLKIEQMPSTPLRGYAQALNAEVVLAL